MSKTYTITLTEAQDKALAAYIVDPKDWIENAVFERSRIAIDEIVKSEIEKKLAAGESISGTKEEIVMAANIETAAEQNERAAAEMAARTNA